MTDDIIAVDPIDFAGSSYAKIADGDYSGLAQGIPGGSDLVSAATALGDGDWASAAISAFGFGASAFAAVVDPLGTLLSSAAGFLMDYMPPLPQALDALAGNPALVEGIGQTWENIATQTEAAAEQLHAVVQKALANWTGVAADAYSVLTNALISGMYQAAHGYRCIGLGLAVASGVVDAVRSFVKWIVSELVGQLISYVIQASATLGIGLTWVIPMATARISITVTDSARATTTLTTTITRATSSVDDIAAAVGSFAEIIKSIAGGVQRAQPGG
ncbi:hypothetical protein [Nocardioides insulae]|uniref:hypothetical protein n=1 Tax=Nocardioides insulae TaxID=394734 RepID=UPI000421C145|nr:hypothetical protein [Nocardioides insulae]